MKYKLWVFYLFISFCQCESNGTEFLLQRNKSHHDVEGNESIIFRSLDSNVTSQPPVTSVDVTHLSSPFPQNDTIEDKTESQNFEKEILNSFKSSNNEPSDGFNNSSINYELNENEYPIKEDNFGLNITTRINKPLNNSTHDNIRSPSAINTIDKNSHNRSIELRAEPELSDPLVELEDVLVERTEESLLVKDGLITEALTEAPNFSDMQNGHNKLPNNLHKTESDNANISDLKFTQNNISKPVNIQKSLNVNSKYNENEFKKGTEILNDESKTRLIQNETFSTTLMIRKCCEKDQFFSLASHSCESLVDLSKLQSYISDLLYNDEVTNYVFETGTIASCPQTHEPPFINGDVTKSTHTILPTGEIVDKLTLDVFNQSYYCLELVGGDSYEVSLTLAYCLSPKATEKDLEEFNLKSTLHPSKDIKDIALNPSLNSTDPSLSHSKNIEKDHKAKLILKSLTIRKCCETFEFYSLNTHHCEPIKDASHFQSNVLKLSDNIRVTNIHYDIGTLNLCPQTNEPPSIYGNVSKFTHEILNSGEIMDIETYHVFRHSDYCLELVGTSMEHSSLTLAFCIQEISKDIFDSTVHKPVNSFRSKELINSDSTNRIPVNGQVINSTSPYLDIVTNIVPLKVRKCCEISHIYSLESHVCEEVENNIDFETSVIELIEDKLLEPISYEIGPIKLCPQTGQPPSVTSDVNKNTYKISSSGEILGKETSEAFGLSDYCLEFVGTNIEDSILTLAFCLPTVPFEDYTAENYGAETQVQEIAPSAVNYQNIVRKCCNENEYYDTKKQKCSGSNNSYLFPNAVQSLSFETNIIDLQIMSGRIHQCPNSSVPPKIIPVEEDAFRLLHTGELIEVTTGLRHNYSHYCLEMVGPYSNEVSFTLALCSHSYKIPKCCPLGKYFDELQLDCLPIPSKHKAEMNLISSFHIDSAEYSLVPLGYLLSCQNTFPIKEPAENLFINEGKLCNHVTCFNKEEFCIDFIGHRNKGLKPSAFYCQKEYFVKCCKEGHILSENGCTEYNEGKSVLLESLSNTRNFINSFDTKRCRRGKGILLDETLSSYVTWWISLDGSYLTVSSEPNKKIVHNYCVDDFIDSSGNVGPGAYVCESDVSHLLPNEHHFLRYSKSGSLGKCCPENSQHGYVFYFSKQTGNCESKPYNESLKDNQYLESGTFTNEHFHDFPECPNKVTGYHSFPFKPGPYDHVEISSQGILKVISRDGRCILREDIVDDRDYCIDYTSTDEGELTVSAFLCAYAPLVDVYSEKFTLVTVLLGISCFFLLLTLIFLFTVRVRRGFVTVRKVNTLAGRILVSFIASHFIGFAAFSLTQHENPLNKEDTIGCYILAGFVQFFNLATFCWNTSICLESLLLTIDISISKCVRYLLHSTWAWGFPMLMTLLMFMMDAYRDELPCGVVTPKIGVSYCFHSDNDAKLLYFYVPILITLLANVGFLFGARAMRNSRLRRLEKGGPKPVTPGRRTDNNAEAAQGNSGMRTHQNQNAKAESLRIVLWTGGTWFCELAGFILTAYIVDLSSEQWYEYLWYIPTSVNALRGVGIFTIIVLTPEKKKEIRSYFKRTKIRMRKLYKSFKESTMNGESSVSKDSMRKSFNSERRRNMSVTTMISTLSNFSTSIYNSSSFMTRSNNGSLRKTSITGYLSSKWQSLRKGSAVKTQSDATDRKVSLNNQININNNNKQGRKFGMIRSVSQTNERRPSSSSGNSFLEELEMEEGHPKRKSSVPLPKLQEEESMFEKAEVLEVEMSRNTKIPLNLIGSSSIKEEQQLPDVTAGENSLEEDISSPASRSDIENFANNLMSDILRITMKQTDGDIFYNDGETEVNIPIELPFHHEENILAELPFHDIHFNAPLEKEGYINSSLNLEDDSPTS